MQKSDVTTFASVTPRKLDDDTRVRMGSMSPSFPAVKPAKGIVADPAKIRMGSMSPAFPHAG